MLKFIQYIVIWIIRIVLTILILWFTFITIDLNINGSWGETPCEGGEESYWGMFIILFILIIIYIVILYLTKKWINYLKRH